MINPVVSRTIASSRDINTCTVTVRVVAAISTCTLSHGPLGHKSTTNAVQGLITILNIITVPYSVP
jgi:hypothetical protein